MLHGPKEERRADLPLVRAEAYPKTGSSGSKSENLRCSGAIGPQTTLYYYRARYYDLATGRFISEDPVRFKSGTVNFYAYADGNPTTLNDPSGLRVRVCCRPLRGKLGHLTGRNHSYVLINPDDNSWQFHTYGLHREDANNKKYPGGARPVLDDPTDIGGTCADVKDATPCKENNFVKNAMQNTTCPSCGKNYFFLGTNSNYWVWDSLKASGMTPPDFPGGPKAPGYSDPVEGVQPPM